MQGHVYAEAFELVTSTIREILEDRGVECGELHDSTPLYPYDEVTTTPLDLDSMDALDVIAVLEEHFGVELPAELDFDSIRTIGDVARTVTDLVEQPAES